MKLGLNQCHSAHTFTRYRKSGFCNFFSIYFHLPIDRKYLKCYLYIIINNKTKKQTL